LLVSPNIGNFLRAGRQFFFFKFSRDIANQGYAICPVKVRKYIIKAFAMHKMFASLLFRLLNANISVNEQPEWFHWAHRRWPFYTYCTPIAENSFWFWNIFFSAYKKITCSKHKIQERQLKNNFTIIDILLRLCTLKSRHIHILCKKYRCIIFIYYIYLYVVCKMKVTYRLSTKLQ
jgi:hypothetical protein